jgi:hypothetical protein
MVRGNARASMSLEKSEDFAAQMIAAQLPALLKGTVELPDGSTVDLSSYPYPVAKALFGSYVIQQRMARDAAKGAAVPPPHRPDKKKPARPAYGRPDIPAIGMSPRGVSPAAGAMSPRDISPTDQLLPLMGGARQPPPDDDEVLASGHHLIATSGHVVALPALGGHAARKAARSPEEGDPARYIRDKLKALRGNATEYHAFTARCDDAVRQGQRDHRAQLLQESSIVARSQSPLNRAAIRVLRGSQRRAAAERHTLLLVTESNTAREFVHHVMQKQDVAEERRVFLSQARFMTRKWLIIIVLTRAGQKARALVQRGYMHRWRSLLVTFIFRHWWRLTKRRCEKIQSLRLNFFIRRTLPGTIESFRLRRCVAATPLVTKFLRQYSDVMALTTTVKKYRRLVIGAQRIMRRKMVTRRMIVAALGLAWRAEAQRMKDERTMMLHFPDRLRDVFLHKVYDADTKEFNRVRFAHFNAHKALVDQAQKFNQMKEMLRRQKNPADGNVIQSQEYMQASAAKKAFMDRQVSHMRKQVESGEWSVKKLAEAATAQQQGQGDDAKMQLHPSQRFGKRAQFSASFTEDDDAAANPPGSPRGGPKSLANVATVARRKSRFQQAVSAPRAKTGMAALTLVVRGGRDIRKQRAANRLAETQALEAEVGGGDMRPMPVLVMPPRKIFSLRVNMRALINASRDVAYTGMRHFREEEAERESALISEMSGGGGYYDEDDDADDTPEADTPEGEEAAARLGPQASVVSVLDPNKQRVKRHGSQKPSLGFNSKQARQQRRESVFEIPPNFDTSDAEYLSTHIDFGFLTEYVRAVMPVYALPPRELTAEEKRNGRTASIPRPKASIVPQ